VLRLTREKKTEIEEHQTAGGKRQRREKKKPMPLSRARFEGHDTGHSFPFPVHQSAETIDVYTLRSPSA